MITDADHAEPGAISADVGIVGGGPAGMAVALELAKTDHTVVLLESGPRTWDRATQALNAPDDIRTGYNTLETRRRSLGGTFTIWGGRWMSLGGLDFVGRPWIPNSGWPFERETLVPFYDRARQLFDTGFEDHSAAALANALARQLPLEGSGLTARLVERSNSAELIEAFTQRLAESPNVTVYLKANALGFELNPRGDRVVTVPFATLAGKRFELRSKVTVLATGGIENARLLLGSGLFGPSQDGPLVGAFFMDHPYVEIGPLRNPVRPTPDDFTVDGREERHLLKAHGMIAFQEDYLRQEELVDCTAHFRLGPRFRHSDSYNSEGMVAARELSRHVRRREVPPYVGGLTWTVARNIHTVAGGGMRAVVDRARPRDAVGVRMMVEGSPVISSRILLGKTRDALGMRRAVVDWQQPEIDRRSATRFVELLSDLLEREGYGHLPSASHDGWPGRILPGYHHMGATRMHEDPRHGVVDANAKMHAVDNLYVAGSSVFPTSGAANPTLTIAALAIRLADHLQTCL
jgi:choline dehydrogenase-like flavoprotein